METAGTKAEELKADGNKLYKEKCYYQACLKYTEAIKLDSSCANYYNNRYNIVHLLISSPSFMFM